jgi:hypothetical protein
MKKNPNDPLGEAAFAKAESSLTGTDGHNSGYEVDLHGGGVKMPKPPTLAGSALTPGRLSSVKKAAAASVQKRRQVAQMKPRRGPLL